MRHVFSAWPCAVHWIVASFLLPITLDIPDCWRNCSTRFDRCRTPMGAVPISVIMGFDYPLEDSASGHYQRTSKYDHYTDTLSHVPAAKVGYSIKGRGKIRRKHDATSNDTL